MDESLKNRTIEILQKEQDQLDGAYDKQSDVEIPEKIEKVNVTQDANGRWSKNTTEEDSGLYNENVVGQLEQQIEDDAKTLQEFCAEPDNIIISFNAQINAKKQEIVTLSAEATARNCWPGIAYSTTSDMGITRNTGIGSTTQNFDNPYSYLQDRDGLKIFELMAGPNVNYSASNPFDPDSTVTLSASYAGYGYENVKQDNGGSVVGIAKTLVSETNSEHNGPRTVGTRRAYLGVGVAPDATNTTLTGSAGASRCVGIGTSIRILYGEIVSLRAQRDAAVNRTNLNAVKSVKKEKELQNWGIKNLEKRVEARKTKNASAISAVQSFL
jgi:hypothetical protein